MSRLIPLVCLSAVCATIMSLGGSCSEDRKEPPTAQAVRQALYEDEGVGLCASALVGPSPNIIEGTPGDDVLEGTAGVDCILGYGGNDIIRGGGGQDLLHGGDGDDIVEGGEGGPSVLVGGRGNDVLRAAGDFSRAFGGLGDDRLESTALTFQGWGDEGQDEIIGSPSGTNYILGGPGDDVIVGGDGEDHLFGDGDPDFSYDVEGADFIDGHGGGDLIQGGDCHDVIVAYAGDTVEGQGGWDACDGTDCELSSASGCSADAECASDERCILAHGLCVPGAQPVCEQRESEDADAGMDAGLGGSLDGGDGEAPLDADLCQPTGNAETSCDGIDDDCDGVADEDFVSSETSCGTGVCFRRGSTSCVTVGPITHVRDSCEPGPPAPSDNNCNSIDDDCDGTSDEDFVSSETSCGIGACARTGSTSCVTVVGPIKEVRDSCEPGEPAPSDATCDGIDDDCDGVADEDFVSSATSCGVGACARTGATSCVTVGPIIHVRDSCVPGVGAAADTTCDGLDDDCDGVADEDFLSSVTSCQVAGCEATGQLVCAAGQPIDTCPTDPVCIGELDCIDGVDNDNDGDTDCFDPDCGCSAVELCGNSLDDDLDGLADCADPDCDGDVVCMDLPPDPVTIAPPVVVPSGDGATYDAVRFLFEGGDPVQRGVANDTIEAPRAHVLRGVVTDVSGSPIPAVRVEVNNHPEYGYTLTRADGAYDMVVNGGDRVTLNFSASSFLPVQRSVMASWDAATTLDDVAMTMLDPEVTTVDLTGVSGAMQVAVGSTMQDGEGERAAMVMVPAGTEAFMTLADGSTVPMTSAHFRATEFTVGDYGLEAMPAELAANTAYTYAVELSFDEALEAHASSVTFSQPVVLYVDNFLNFPVGGVVPTGYYDREQAQWLPLPDGRVVQVVGVDAEGRAQVDVTGDGAADDFAAELEPLGFSNAELMELTQQHGIGASLWRTRLTHFTPCDLNWPNDPPWGAAGPPPAPPPPGPPPVDPPTPADPTPGPLPEPDDCEDGPHSTVYCLGRSLGESVPITGTDLSLEYHSSRAQEGRRKSFSVTLTEGPLDPKPKYLTMDVYIAGRKESFKFSAAPNQSYEYVWDGKDSYGRTIVGDRIRAGVQLCYWYQGYYSRPALEALGFSDYSFGSRLRGPPFPEGQLARPGTEVSLCQFYRKTVAGESVLPLWEVNAVRQADSTSGFVSNPSGRIEPVNQSLVPLYREHPGRNLYVAPDGTYLTLESMAPTDTALLLMRDGDVWVPVPGQEQSHFRAEFSTFTPVVFYDGWAYFVEHVTATPDTPYMIVKYRFSVQEGLTNRTVVLPGTGAITTQGITDPVPVEDVRLYGAIHMAVDPRDGAVHFTDANAAPDGVFRVTPGGTVERVDDVFNRSSNTQTLSFDIARDGSIVRGERTSIPGETVQGIVVYRPDGRKEVVASWALQNCPSPFAGSLCSLPVGLMVDEKNARVLFALRIGNSGPYALFSAPMDGGSTSVLVQNLSEILRQGSTFNTPNPVPYFVKGSDGDVYLGDRAFLGAPGGVVGATTIWKPALVSNSGGLDYTFHPDGRADEAREPTTGALVYRFEYTDNLLTSIMTGDGLSIAIGRAPGTGRIEFVESPYGQRTLYEYDGAGRLSTIRDPDSVDSTVTYHGSSRLMATFTNRNGVTSSYNFGEHGELVHVEDAEGWLTLEARDDFNVVKRDADGRVTQYVTYTDDQGNRTRYVRLPDGTLNAQTRLSDGTQVLTAADGSVRTNRVQVDPLAAGKTMPAEQTLTLPSGLSMQTITSRSVASDGTVTDLRTVNGNAWLRAYDPLTRTWTSQTPEGRTSTTTLDELGRPVTISQAGRAAVQLSYDQNGRLWQTSSGSTSIRTTTITYGDDDPSFFGRAKRISSTDASDVVFDARDPLGRVLAQSVETTSGPVTTAMGWDNLGNMTELITPSSDVHDLTYDGRNAVETYAPPELADASRPGILSISYTSMGEAASMTLANGAAIMLNRDPVRGRVDQAVMGSLTYTYAYHPDTGKLSGITGSDGTALTMAYDGPLVVARTWGGSSSPVSGSVGFGYNADFNLSLLTVNGSEVATFGYDDDQLLTSAGELAIVRHAASGDIDATTLDGVTTDTALDEHGAMESFESFYADAPVYAYNVTSRDGQGRIVEVIETFGSESRTKGYRYDELGRLRQVLDDGVVSATYEYDDNGNRLPGTYDEQDRIQSFGGCSYVMDAAGFLSQRDCGEGAEAFVYDARGALRQVTLANGDVIDYVIDPQGRRIGRKVNGVFDKGWLYLDDLRPAAQIDSLGQLEAVYVYGTRPNVPDYIVDKSGGSDVVYRVLADHLGTPRRVVRASDGQVVHELDLDAWGNVVREAGSRQDLHPFGFAGGIWDRESELLRYGVRDYDPYVGRWTARDPVLFDGGTENLYVYVGGDPTNKVDPSGLFAFAAPLICAAGGCEAAAAAGAAIFTASAAAIGLGISECIDQFTEDDDDEDDCAEEWAHAREVCSRLRDSGDPDYRQVFGGSYSRCLRGQVSERCGGNPVVY